MGSVPEGLSKKPAPVVHQDFANHPIGSPGRPAIQRMSLGGGRERQSRAFPHLFMDRHILSFGINRTYLLKKVHRVNSRTVLPVLATISATSAQARIPSFSGTWPVMDIPALSSPPRTTSPFANNSPMNFKSHRGFHARLIHGNSRRHQ